MIPRVIHYCWFGGKALPKDAQRCINTWRKQCPGFELKEWNEKNFDVNSHPFIKAAYESKAWAFVTDYVRLKVVFDNGGIYLDTDVRVLRNLSPLLDHPAFFGAEQLNYFVATGLGFGAEKNNKIVESLLMSYNSVKFDSLTVMDLACPKLNTNIFIEYGYKQNGKFQDIGDAVIYPPEYFDPIAPGTNSDLTCKNTYSIHLYNASWTPLKSVLKAKIRRTIGAKNTIRIKRFLKK